MQSLQDLAFIVSEKNITKAIAKDGLTAGWPVRLSNRRMNTNNYIVSQEFPCKSNAVVTSKSTDLCNISSLSLQNLVSSKL